MDKKPSAPTIAEVLRFKNLVVPAFSVIPLLLETKLPAVKWKTVIDGRPFTDDELREYWDKFKGKLNPGIATGRFCGNGVIVIDADNEQGVRWVEENLPPTLMRTITRAGKHFYLRGNGPDGERIPNMADVLGAKARWAWEAKEKLDLDVVVRQKREQSESDLQREQERAAIAREEAERKLEMGPLIDVRGDGGQVVAPGAIHPSGFVYAMEAPWSQAMLDGLAMFDPDVFEGKKWTRPGSGGPVSMKNLASKRVEKQLDDVRSNTTQDDKLKRASAWLEHVDPAVAGGGGHNKTFYAACRLVCGFMLSVEDAYGLLKTDYNPKCQPPWSDEELAHKVMDAEKQLGQNDGYMLVDRPDFVAKQKVKELGEYIPSGDDFDVDDMIEDFLEDEPAAAGNGGGSGAPPPPSGGGGNGGSGATPPAPAPGSTDDDRMWQQKWKRYGIDYMAQVKGKPERVTVKQNQLGQWKIPPHPNNLAFVIQYSRYFKTSLRRNELKLWNEINGRRLDDSDVLVYKSDLDHMWQDKIPKEDIKDALNMAAAINAYEPTQDWLKSLPAWDGVLRLEKLPEDILGSDPNPVVGTMFRHFMTGLVARIMKPGIKVDTITILVGPQGAFKSQFWRILIDGDLDGSKWFSDSPFKLGDKDGMLLVGTNILVEWSESEHAKSGLKIDRVKAFLSQQQDEFRPPFGTNVIERARRCVFVGTSNDRELLHDITGSRRFYIINTSSEIDLDGMLDIRDQLYAEALDLYNRWKNSKKGTKEYDATRWWFDKDEDKARAEVVREFEARGVWHEDIANWLIGRAGEKHPEFTIGEVIEQAIKMDRDKKKKHVENEVRNTLVSLGCKNLGRCTRRGKQARWWAPPAEAKGPDDDLPI
jgi:predicted P-loop ATPase